MTTARGARDRHPILLVRSSFWAGARLKSSGARPCLRAGAARRDLCVRIQPTLLPPRQHVASVLRCEVPAVETLETGEADAIAKANAKDRQAPTGAPQACTQA